MLSDFFLYLCCVGFLGVMVFPIGMDFRQRRSRANVGLLQMELLSSSENYAHTYKQKMRTYCMDK